MSKELEIMGSKIRKTILKLAMQAANAGKGSHLGGAMSAVEILSYLFFSKKFKLAPKGNERFILSKGHASLVLYSTLYHYGCLSESDILAYPCNDTSFLGHPVQDRSSGIEFSTGSLGMGLSMASGTALSIKKKGDKENVFVLVGDGELNEGIVWESLRFIVHNDLSNLTVLVDSNKFQQTGTTEVISKPNNIPDSLRNLGLFVKEIDGHSYLEIENALSATINCASPSVIYLNTIKGRGLPERDDMNYYHHVLLPKSVLEELYQSQL